MNALGSHRTENIYPQIVASDSSYVHAGDVYLSEHSDLTQEQKCHQVLKTSTYEDYKDRNPPRVEGTCQWVLTHPKFQRWRHSNHDDLLWISADPGCGKSVLAKSLVDHDLVDGSQSIICYFFFKDNREQDNLATALCAILHQLFTQQPNLIRYALPFWKKVGENLRLETRDMWRILQFAAADPSLATIICVIDALDECCDQDRRQLISFLCDLSRFADSNSGRQLKFLVTSRPYDNVQRWFEPAISQWPCLRLRGEDENEQIHREIGLVIDHHVRNLSTDFALSTAHQDRLRHSLDEMQHRTYLWLHLAMEEIRESYQSSLYPDTVVIDSLPQSVENAYDRLLQKINQKQQPIARQVLLIIIGARRPLTIEEMGWALASLQAYQAESKSLAKPDVQHLERQIRNWCGLFIFIHNSTLFLIHQTAKEFLLLNSPTVSTTPSTWRGNFSTFQVELEMAKICTVYVFLTFSDMEQTLKKRLVMGRDNKAKIPCRKPREMFWFLAGHRRMFYHYCAQYWATHLQDEMLTANPLLLSYSLALYGDSTNLFLSWFDLWSVSTLIPRPQRLDEMPNQQHVAVFNNHLTVLKHLYERKKFDINEPDSRLRTSLVWAAVRGHLRIAHWVIEQDESSNPRPDSYTLALIEAARYGHKEVLQMLLDVGVDVNGALLRETALQAASEGGHEDVVQILVNAGANINAHPRFSKNALSIATKNGHEKVVQILINEGIHGNVDKAYIGNALTIASEEGYGKIVQILIDSGVNEDTYGKFFESALISASALGHENIVQILVNAGANFQSHRGYSSLGLLQGASIGGYDKIVQLLIDAGVNVDDQDLTGNSALHVASAWGHENVVQVLINAGAHVNAQRGHFGDVVGSAPDGRTALHVASERGQEKIVQMLINAGANINVPEGRYSSALLAASPKE